MILRRILRRYLWLIALELLMFHGAAANQAEAAANDRWQWLNGTYWYVPNIYLPAIASNPAIAQPLPVSDQTVYRIDHYQAGYFWGITAVTYQAPQASIPPSVSCLQLVGSVTPQGNLHLTFTALQSQNLSEEPTVGIGAMTLQEGQWTMENQMSAVAVGNLLLTHWAYMYQCKPDQPCFQALPGIGISMPEFLGPCATEE
jgi:hypothetical protein